MSIFNTESKYVVVRTPMVLNRRVRPAFIDGSFESKKAYEKAIEANEIVAGRFMTRKQSKKFIEDWNLKIKTVKA